jgi:hypothetical protein
MSVCSLCVLPLVCFSSRQPGKRELIGYSCLKLRASMANSSSGQFIVDDVYQLPIAAKLPRNYLQVSGWLQ